MPWSSPACCWSEALADRFGRRRVFLIGLTVFALGSIGAALSGSVTVLHRISGPSWEPGAALTIPTSLAIINDMFRNPGERARAIGVWAGTIGLGIALGPIAGGLLLSRFWWGSIFFVNVPIACIGFIGAALEYPSRRTRTFSVPIPSGPHCRSPDSDCCSGRSSRARPMGGPPVDRSGRGLASLVVLAAFVVWESRSTHPMLKLEFFRDRRLLWPSPQSVLRRSGSWGRSSCRPSSSSSISDSLHSEAGIPILPIAVMIVVGGRHVSLGGPSGRYQIRRGGRSFRDRCRPMASIGLVRLDTTFGDVVLGLSPDRLGCRAHAAHGHELGDRVGPPGRLWDGFCQQHCGTSGWRGLRRRGDRQCDADPLPGPHDGGTGRPACAQPVAQSILGSLGAALAVAERVGGSTGVELARAARTGFMSGNELALAVGAIVALVAADSCSWRCPHMLLFASALRGATSVTPEHDHSESGATERHRLEMQSLQLDNLKRAIELSDVMETIRPAIRGIAGVQVPAPPGPRVRAKGLKDQVVEAARKLVLNSQQQVTISDTQPQGPDQNEG